MNEGLDEERAYEKAVEEMGEPEYIGASLHAIHKPKVEWSVILSMIAVITIGAFVLGVYSMSYSEMRCIEKQILFIGIGIVSFLVLYFIDYHKLEFIMSYVAFVRKWANRGLIGYGILAGTAVIATILCTVSAAMEGIYMTVVFMSIFIAYMMSKSFKGNRKKVSRGLLSGSILGLGLVTWYICHSPQRIERIMVWLDPNRDPMGDGYLNNVIREILRGATWFGEGTGVKIQGIEKYLPDLHVDFIFIFIIGTMGYLVAGGIILVIGMMLIRCFKASQKVNDEYGRMLLKAISIFFTIQYVMSLLMNIALVPITAVSIPFISYGGSRIVCDLALMGFFLGIYRRKDILPYELLKNKEECQGEEVKSRKYNNIILGWALNIIRTSEDIEEVNITFKQK